MIGYTGIVLGALTFYTSILKSGESTDQEILLGIDEDFADPEKFKQKADKLSYILADKSTS